MSHKKVLLIFTLSLLFIIACSLPSAQLDKEQIAQITAIAKTVQAVSGNVISTPLPNKSTQAGSEPTKESQSQAPPPTTIPTRAAPTAKANTAPASTSISIGNFNITPANIVYYGNCSAGEETSVHIEVPISPLEQVKDVHLWYDIMDSTGIVSTGWETMWQLGTDDYAMDLNIGTLAPQVLVDPDGTLSFGVEAKNKNDEIFYSNTYSLDIWDCGGGVLGPPPASAATIALFSGPDNATAGDKITLEWDVLNACKVFLNGDEVPIHTGVHSYTIPSGWGGQYYGFSLTAWGSSCDNSTEVNANHSVWVNALQTTIATGSGNLQDSLSLDLGDGNGDDIIFDHQLNATVLFSVWGSELKVFGPWEPSVSQCESDINAGSFSEIHIDVDKYICYKTGSGNYGYLNITGMYLDLDDRTNSYTGVSYHTEITQ